MRPLGPLSITALAVSVLAVSSSAPLIAYAAAPALAIAFWRNALAVGLLAPIAAVGRRHELLDLVRTPAGRRTGLTCVLSGLCLAVHFATWIPSAKLTSVATATALVSTAPVWTAMIAVLGGMHVPRVTWLGIGVAVLGAALATGADLGVSSRAVLGDLLALVGGAAAAVYTTYGERVRASTSTLAYTTVCYSVCSAALAVICLVGGVRFTGFDQRTWLAIAAMTLGPQLLGHSLIAYALHKVPATTVSVSLLLEVPGAALLGWVLLRQLPAGRSVPGLAVLVAGVGIVIVGARRRSRRSQAPMTV